MTTPSFLTASTLDVPHGFFGRQGGVSAGVFASLNVGLGSSDDAAAVAENRARVRNALGADHLTGLHQIHSADVITVAAPHGERQQGDGMVTNVRGLALGILTADCVPVLFADKNAGVIGACHAGWRGALAGVALNTIAAMRQLGASNITAALGPCIQQRSYEVGPEFPAPFLAADPANAGFFDAALHFDLPGFLLRQLAAAGVSAVSLGVDTYENPADYFSYRRKTHLSEPDYGRQISAICLI